MVGREWIMDALSSGNWCLRWYGIGLRGERGRFVRHGFPFFCPFGFTTKR